MSKSISMMADEILGGALTDPTTEVSEAVESTEFSMANHPGQPELPAISDEIRNALLSESMGVAPTPKKAVAEEMSDDEIDSVMNTAAKKKFGAGSTQAKRHSNFGKKPPMTPAQKAAAAKKKRDAEGVAAADSGATPPTTPPIQTSGLKRATSGTTMTLVDAKKPSAGLSKKEKKEVAKKAGKGKDIGKKGKNFDKVADKAAEEYGSEEAGEKVAGAAMWKNMKREQREVIRKARAILDEMTAAGSIGANMAGSANKDYDNNAKPMGEDGVKIEPVDKSLRKTDKPINLKRSTKKADKKADKKPAKKKKEVAVTKESFENFLNLIVTEAQK